MVVLPFLLSDFAYIVLLLLKAIVKAVVNHSISGDAAVVFLRLSLQHFLRHYFTQHFLKP